jgi:hypothetical protein
MGIKGPTAICELIVYTKCGSLDVSQSYGPSRPVTGRALPFHNSSQSVTAKVSFHSLLDYERLLSHVGWQIDLIPAAD